VVTDLSDPRFSEANAASGLWRPVEFVFQVGAGVYFLEPYDPDKTPVVFVHGALGHPGNFRFLIEQLDRSRFQPWLVYYPTAAGLGAVVESLDRWLRWLAAVHGFEHYAIVAHSMGGLVARGYVNGLADGTSLDAPDVLVTIATPWLGHESAAVGVRRAPVVAPSWFDMAPGSPFLAALFAQPLPEDTAFDLLFAYGGRPRGGPSNDGVVTIASQLAPSAQDQAQRVFGIDAGHAAVLREPETAHELNALLAPLAP
jgi:pimeloyl-ACP methyl ester carboxylesterase